MPHPTRTVAIVSQKGGAGKTTLTVHLAVAAVRDGLMTAVLDVDPQHSAEEWYRIREAHGLVKADGNPAVIAVDARDVPARIAQCRANGCGLVLIDTAPRLDAQATQVAAAADYVLMPVRPALFDLAAAHGTAAIVRASGARAAFVLSACPPRAPETNQMREALSELGFPLAPVEIAERRAFARAVIDGRAVDEFEPTGKAAGEIGLLWKWLKREIKTNGKA